MTFVYHAQSFKGPVAWITQYVLVVLIQWIVIYPLNSIDYPLDESSSIGFINRVW